MKLKDIKPGQFFRREAGDVTYMKVRLHRSTQVKVHAGKESREHISISLDDFQIATFAIDGDVDVELVNPEDVPC